MKKKLNLQLFAVQLADIIVPEDFEKYVVQETAEKSRVFNSNMIAQSEQLNQALADGGLLFHMPYWQELNGTDQVLSFTDDITEDTFKAGVMQAHRLIRANAWKSHDLATILAGDDPVKALAGHIGGFWSRNNQKTLIALLNGLFAHALKTTHVNDISAGTGNAAIISAEAVLDTKQLLGDNAEIIGTLYMHSAVYTTLQKQNLITGIPNSRAEVGFGKYLNLYDIVVDDGVPYDAATKVYTTYLVGDGAVGMANYGYKDNNGEFKNGIELYRNALGSTDGIISRLNFALHPAGMSFDTTKFTSSDAKPTPGNDDLVKAVYKKATGVEDKQIPFLALKHKI